MIYVLAGTYEQYRAFCADKGLNHRTEAAYVYREEKIQGQRDFRWCLVGTWEQRIDSDDVYGTLLSRAPHGREYP